MPKEMPEPMEPPAMLHVGDYSMAKEPMAVNVRCVSELETVLTLQSSGSGMDRIERIILGMDKKDVNVRTMKSQFGSGIVYQVIKNFNGAVGVLYVRDNLKLHFETRTSYTENIEITTGLFGRSVRTETRKGTVFLTATIPYILSQLSEIKIKDNMLIFAFKIGETEKFFAFEFEDTRRFIDRLYQWADRKGIALPAIKDEKGEEPRQPEPYVPPAAEQGLSAVIISPYNITVDCGTVIQFSAKAVDAQGKELKNVVFEWRVSTPALGTIDATGRLQTCGMGAAGNVIVIATYNGVTKTDFASVTVRPPALVPSEPQVERYVETPKPVESFVANCPACGAEVSIVAETCYSCGKILKGAEPLQPKAQFPSPLIAKEKQLEAEKETGKPPQPGLVKCSSCGTEISAIAKECYACGAKRS